MTYKFATRMAARLIDRYRYLGVFRSAAEFWQPTRKPKKTVFSVYEYKDRYYIYINIYILCVYIYIHYIYIYMNQISNIKYPKKKYYVWYRPKALRKRKACHLSERFRKGTGHFRRRCKAYLHLKLGPHSRRVRWKPASQCSTAHPPWSTL